MKFSQELVGMRGKFVVSHPNREGAIALRLNCQTQQKHQLVLVELRSGPSVFRIVSYTAFLHVNRDGPITIDDCGDLVQGTVALRERAQVCENLSGRSRSGPFRHGLIFHSSPHRTHTAIVTWTLLVSGAALVTWLNDLGELDKRLRQGYRLIVSRPDPLDRRLTFVRLTPQGRAFPADCERAGGRHVNEAA